MKIYKNSSFSDWALKYSILDDALILAVKEMNQGTFEANLGGSVYKKRIAIGNKGKSAGVRTIVAFVVNERAFFIYGFAKNKLDNIDEKELKALKRLAKIYLHLTDGELSKAVQERKLIKVG
jgi:hypothetical protein